MPGVANAGYENKLLGYPATTAISGKVIPIVYGTRRVGLNLICSANWIAKAIGSKLKGGAGKGGANQQYDYFSTVILGICHGPILGTGQLWANNIRYATSGGGSQAYVETYTVPPGGGTFTPTFANQTILDLGVYVVNAFSVSVNDFGSPGSTTLTGSQNTAMQPVSGQTVVSATPVTRGKGYLGPAIVTFVGGLAPGGVAATGHCVMSVDPGGDLEGLASIVIDSGGGPYLTAPVPVITPNPGNGYGSGATAYATLGSPGAGSGSLGAGQYYFDSATGSYTFGAAAAGTTVQIGYVWNQASPLNGAAPAGAIGFAILTGDLGQAPWTFLTSNNPNLALGYSEVALACNQQFELGSSGVVPNLSIEVFGFALWGAGVQDAPALMPESPICTPIISGGLVLAVTLNWPGTVRFASPPPVTIIGDGQGATATATLNADGLLTAINVATNGSSYTKASVYVGKTLETAQGGIIVDLLTNPLWGVSGDLGFFGWEIADTTDVASFVIANSIFFSLALEAQTTAVDVLRRLLKACIAEGFWSEGMLKFRAYGDTSAVGNGLIYSPQTAPIYDLDIDNFLSRGKGKDFITIERTALADRKNRWSVEWANRYNSYNLEPITEDDDSSIQTSPSGINPQAVERMDYLCSQPAAQLVVNTLKKNGLYKNNTYSFGLGLIGILIEPMDLVTVTDPYVGLITYPVRVLRMTEKGKCVYDFECEDFPWGTAQPTQHPKQVTSTFGPGFYATPGPVTTPIFWEALAQQIQDGGYILYIALSGGQNWGGCDVYESNDGVTYNSIGRQNGPSTRGVLTADLPDGSDPDTSHTLSVDLTQSLGKLSSFTAAQENAFISLVLVDQELMSYENATLTAAYQYNLTNLRRGVFGTPIQSHEKGASFLFFDSGLFSWKYDATDIGQLRYFKFTSFNQAGQLEQSLSDSSIVAYSYRIVNPRAPYPWNAYSTYSDFYPNDALTNRSFFTIQQYYTIRADGSVLAQFLLTGLPPINTFSKKTSQPTIAFVSTSSTGGSIPAGSVVVVAVAAIGVDAYFSPLSELVEFTVPAGTNTNTVTFSVAYQNNVSTTVSASVSPGTQTVTPASMANINVGTPLLIDDAHTGLEEVVTVTAITSSTFTATFVNSHAGPFNVTGDSGIAFVASGSDELGLVSNQGVQPGNGNFTVSNLAPVGQPCPDSRFDHFQVQAKVDVHAGIWGGPITSLGCSIDCTVGGGTGAFVVPIVSSGVITGLTILNGGQGFAANFSPNILGLGTGASVTLTVSAGAITGYTGLVGGSGYAGGNVMQITGATWTTNQLVGRPVSILAKADNSPVPIANAKITANTADTITLNQDFSSILLPNDIIVVRSQPTACTRTVVTDANWVNGGPGQLGTGLTPGVEAGNYLWVVAGTGAGQILPIASNTNDALTLGTPLTTLLDSTSVCIVVGPTWITLPPTQSLMAATWSLSTILPSVDNTIGYTYLVQVLTSDANGDMSDETVSPFREIYQPGSPGMGANLIFQIASPSA